MASAASSSTTGSGTTSTTSSAATPSASAMSLPGCARRNQPGRASAVMRYPTASGIGGCPGTGVLARRHNAPAAVAVAETWAAEVQNGSAFDEPAFPYACFCHGATWAEGLSRRTPPNEPYSAAWEFAPAVPHAAAPPRRQNHAIHDRHQFYAERILDK